MDLKRSLLNRLDRLRPDLLMGVKGNIEHLNVWLELIGLVFLLEE